MVHKTFLAILLVSSIAVSQHDSVLIFLSDTQAPIWFERLYLAYNDNATQNLFGEILHEKNVAGVIHAGDITSYGSVKSNWKSVVPFFDTLAKRNIPFLAAKGNHDYLFTASSAMQNFQTYVPNGIDDYSASKLGSAGLVILNSNDDELEEGVKQSQIQWYRKILMQYNADTTVHSIITLLHHSPFTNSTMVEGNKNVRETILPEFYGSKKSVLFISGHAHRFEHFRKNGKDFIVIGGGGGLFHNKRNPPPEEDLYKGIDDGKFFHYVRCMIGDDSLHIEIVKIGKKTEIVHQFSVASALK